MIDLSASSISDWKDCAFRFYRRYLQRLRKIEISESKRWGTNWHKLQELYPDLDTITDYVNKVYETVPPNITQENWLIERTILLYSIFAFHWYYSAQPIQYKVLAKEIEFRVPLTNNSAEVVIGFIDQIVEDDLGNRYVREFKSTFKNILDNEYWDHLNLDTQTGIYLLAAQYLQLNGKLKQYGITPDDPLINRILYNAWHKPKIRPKWTTQGDAKVLIETCEYCGHTFEDIVGTEADNTIIPVSISGTPVKIEPGKKQGTFAIYETPEMFGARLMQDMTTNPETYFQQRELSRTFDEIRQLATEIHNVRELIVFQEQNNLWFKDEKQCSARFRCEFKELCDHNVEVDLANPPIGFEVKGKK